MLTAKTLASIQTETTAYWGRARDRLLQRLRF
jgi:hypothetical protein